MLVHMKDLSSSRVLLTTLAGVEDVHLDGDSIVGRWKPVNELTYISNRTAKRGGPLNFVNIKSDDQILRFTEKYGTLGVPAGSCWYYLPAIARRLAHLSGVHARAAVVSKFRL